MIRYTRSIPSSPQNEEETKELLLRSLFDYLEAQVGSKATIDVGSYSVAANYPSGTRLIIRVYLTDARKNLRVEFDTRWTQGQVAEQAIVEQMGADVGHAASIMKALETHLVDNNFIKTSS